MIRRSTPDDFSDLIRIYAAARSIMEQSGNPFQWGKSKPSLELIQSDIMNGTGYLLEENGRPYGAFALLFDPDPTYSEIEGSWKNNAPYATLHRVASDGSHKQVFSEILIFCRALSKELRIDTHEDNCIMRKLLTREGFEYCGVIHLADGSPRLAFQWSAHSSNRCLT